MSSPPDRELTDFLLNCVAGEVNGITTERICKRTRKTPQELGAVFEGLIATGQVLGFAGLWLSPDNFELGSAKLLASLEELHTANPTTSGFVPDNVVRAAELPWSGKPLNRIVSRLAEEGRIAESDGKIRLPAFRLQLTSRQRSLLDRVIENLEQETVNTPSPQALAQQLGIPRQAIEEILKLGIQAGEVQQIGEVVFYTPRQIAALKDHIAEVTNGHPFSSNDLRDKLSTTRKYTLPLLDYLDEIGFTLKIEGHRKIQESRA